MDNVLKIGDRVTWRGAYGKDAPCIATIEHITLTRGPYQKGGEDVEQISLDTLRQGLAVIDLDNGHWAYANQVAPYGNDPQAWHNV